MEEKSSTVAAVLAAKNSQQRKRHMLTPLFSQDPEQGMSKRGKFPKSARLLTSSQYKHLHQHAIRLVGEQIVLDFREGVTFSPRLGITVSRKFGKAHERNRFKRCVREAFRELYFFLPHHLELNISPRKKISSICKQAILLDLQRLLAKIAVR